MNFYKVVNSMIELVKLFKFNQDKDAEALCDFIMTETKQ